MQGFIVFIRKQGVIGLAVGFILGGAVSKVISALITDIVNPILGVILGAAGGLKEASLSTRFIGHHHVGRLRLGDH